MQRRIPDVGWIGLVSSAESANSQNAPAKSYRAAHTEMMNMILLESERVAMARDGKSAVTAQKIIGLDT